MFIHRPFAERLDDFGVEPLIYLDPKSLQRRPANALAYASYRQNPSKQVVFHIDPKFLLHYTSGTLSDVAT